MKCCNCKNLGKLIDENGEPYDWCEKVCDNPDTHMERKCRHYAVASNADRIRSMTDEELATVIAWPYLASPPWCANHTTCPYISEDPTPCDKCALDWLRQEAEDG